jgi:hypothetical protein
MLTNFILMSEFFKFLNCFHPSKKMAAFVQPFFEMLKEGILSNYLYQGSSPG